MGLVNEASAIRLNVRVGPGLYMMSVAAPLIARSLQPGQFVHMRIPGMEGHILRRPFSVYDMDADAGVCEILYQVVGFGTDRMTQLEPGFDVEMIGPVGHGWTIPVRCGRALLVGGGVGAAPLYLHARELNQMGVVTDVVLGAQTGDAVVTRSRYADLLGHDPVIATDDGTLGYHGFCTSPTAQLLETYAYDHIACCGPEPLMKIVADMARDVETECQVSMERRMACGIGACLSCVVDTEDGKKRSCVDGPVFDAHKVVWS